jgi:hypothetical protein
MNERRSVRWCPGKNSHVAFDLSSNLVARSCCFSSSCSETLHLLVHKQIGTHRIFKQLLSIAPLDKSTMSSTAPADETKRPSYTSMEVRF